MLYKDFFRRLELWKNVSSVRKSITVSSIHLSCLNVFSKKKSKETCIEFELFVASETLKAGAGRGGEGRIKSVLSSLRDYNTVGRGLVHCFL